MTMSRRLVLGAGAVPIAGTAAFAVAEAQTSGSAPEIRTFESFGAKGDAPDLSGRGTDDTAAIQAAIDWAYGGGLRLPRALFMGDKAYLCGNITLHPTTTIVGTGRQTSAFICKGGTSGTWFGTRGGGAQKIMLSGIAFYARGERGISHILELGTGANEHPLGTESILQGLWMRDAPEGIALAVNGNVAIITDITCQSARIGISATGSANHAQNIFVMQAGEGFLGSKRVIGADFSGWFVRGLHVEATVERGVPLRLRGNCQILHAFISTVTGYRHDHLIEIDDRDYREWSLGGVRLSENRYLVRNGIIKHSRGYAGGKEANGFTGRSLAPEDTNERSGADPGHLAATNFVITFASGADGLRHSASAPGRPDVAISDAGPLAPLPTSAVRTTLEEALSASGGQLAGAARNRFLFDLIRPVSARGSAIAVVERNSSRVPINVSVELAAGSFALVFTHAATGEAINLTDLPRGSSLSVNVRAEL